MSERYATSAEIVKFEPAQSCGASRTKVRKNSFAAAVMRIAQGFFGAKALEKIAPLAACSKRTAEHWKGDTREMDMGDFFRVVGGNPALGVEVLDLLWQRLPDTTRALWRRQLEAKFEDERAEQEEREFLERKRQRELDRLAQPVLPLNGKGRR